MVVEHLDANDGEWPKNWNALRDDYQTCVKRSGRPWEFEQLRTRVAVDWDANPKKLINDSDASDIAAFRVIWLRDGTNSYWEGYEPNQIILRYLRSLPTPTPQHGVTAEEVAVTGSKCEGLED